MDNSNVALITKLVLEAVEKQKTSDDAGYLVPIECPRVISTSHRSMWRLCSEKGISSQKEKS